MNGLARFLIAGFLIISILIVLNGTLIYAAHVLETDKGEHDPLPEIPPERKGYVMQATAYCLNGQTATGTQTRVGVAASKREWFGKTVRVYRADRHGYPMELIGEYVIEDTGGDNIQNGKAIDIWLPTYEECKVFGRKRVVVYLGE